MQRRTRIRISLLLLASLIVLATGIATFVIPSLRVNAANTSFNNEGISPKDGVSNSASFDGSGHSYSNTALQNVGFASGSTVKVNGVSFTWPTITGGTPDNWQSAGQVLPVSLSAGSTTLAFLGASANGTGSGTATLRYSDSTTQNVTLAFSDWALPGGQGLLPGESIAATTPYRNTSSGGRQNFNVYVFYTTVAVDSSKTLTNVTLPSSTSPGKLHVFAVQGFVPSAQPSNEGISPHDTSTHANFDGAGHSYSGVSLQAAGFGSGSMVTVNGITFQWPTVSEGTADNWRAAGQVIPVSLNGTGGTLGILGAGANGSSSGTATLHYSDNSTQSVTLAFSDWALPSGTGLLPGESVAAVSRYRDTSSGGRQNFNVYVFFTSVPLAAGKTLTSITLPNNAAPGQLHVFAIQGAAAPSSTPTPTPSPTPTQPNTTPDWTTYLNNINRTGYNSNETALNVSTFPNLKLKWQQQVSTINGATAISTQAVEENGVVYWSSWNGIFYATSTATGQNIWTASLGQTQLNSCNPTHTGITSTATLGTIGSTPAVFVAGGHNVFYALNQATGAVLWSTNLANNNHPNTGDFLWSSPAVYNGNVYIGMASLGDCPLVQGQLIELSAATGQVENTFNVVPNGCDGGGVSGSPVVDTATGIVYIATGNPDQACGAVEPYGSAVIALHASDLSFIGAWQIPNAFTADLDFVNTPTLFTATIGGNPRQLIGVVNKNGIYYAFDRSNISAGPIWQAQIAIGGDCPQCGNGSISPSAWDGTNLYVAGGNVTINGKSCQGSVNALNPANGAFLWRQCTNNGHVLGALTAVPGVVVDNEGTWVVARNTSNGAVIFSFNDTHANADFWGAPTVADDHLYVGGEDGFFFAFGL